MFSIFKRNKESKVTDLAWLGVDMHSHLLPGIDDGSKDIVESVSYIKSLTELGFSKLICTPHVFSELYPNTPEIILPVLGNVVEALVSTSIDVKIDVAAEYMIDETFNVKAEHLCLPNKHLLIEMSYLSEAPNIEQVIFDLQIKGYNIILAHPERYNFYHKNLDRYQRLKDMGCLFQLNLLSVLGYYGKDVKSVTEYLLEKRLYDFGGTDLHHEKHLEALEVAVTNGHLFNRIGRYEFKNKQIFE